jgi:uncharacterized protein YndB with AHSA1/START domain
MPRTIILATSLPAPPERLYEMYVDSKLHAAFTGLPVEIEPRPGGTFRAFNGAIWGTILDVVPNRQIVQRWRSKNFPQEAIDSTLVLSFWPEVEPLAGLPRTMSVISPASRSATADELASAYSLSCL